MLLIITILVFSFISIVSISQTGHLPQLSAWRSEFHEQEFVPANYNTVINFTLNVNSIPSLKLLFCPAIVLTKKNKP
jgi:hypothetical protein